MAEKKSTGIPPGAWFLILVAIFGLGAFYAHIIPEDQPGAATGTDAVASPGDGQGVPASPSMGSSIIAAKQLAGTEPLVGTWRSNDDARFMREFRADGTITDRYEGDANATQTGTWMEVDPAQENVGMSADSLAGMRVIRATFSDGLRLYYGVSGVTETQLTLMYLGRGNVLSFTKVMQ